MIEEAMIAPQPMTQPPKTADAAVPTASAAMLALADEMNMIWHVNESYVLRGDELATVRDTLRLAATAPTPIASDASCPKCGALAVITPTGTVFCDDGCGARPPLIALLRQAGQSEAGWRPIESAESDDIVLVGNPVSGTLPVIAWRIQNTWYAYDLSQRKPLDPQPTIWTRWPKLPSPPNHPRGGPWVG